MTMVDLDRNPEFLIVNSLMVDRTSWATSCFSCSWAPGAADTVNPIISNAHKPSLLILFILFSFLFFIEYYDSTINNKRIPEDEKPIGTRTGFWGIEPYFSGKIVSIRHVYANKPVIRSQ
jgi:hypothetical protein